MPPDVTREKYTAWSKELYLVWMNYVIDINAAAGRRVVNAAREDEAIGHSVYNLILFCRKQHECITYQDAKEIDNAIAELAITVDMKAEESDDTIDNIRRLLENCFGSSKDHYWSGAKEPLTSKGHTARRHERKVHSFLPRVILL